MPHIVAPRDPDVLRHLAWGPLARMAVTYEAVPTADLLEAVRRLRPRLAILDAEGPDRAGLERCRELRRQPELSHTQALLVCAEPATLALFDAVAAVGGADLTVGRVGVAEFSTHVQDLLGLPRRHYRRVPVELVAWVETGARVYRGVAENLSLGGLKVRLDAPLTTAGPVQVRLMRHERDDGLVVEATVAWFRDLGREAGLEFTVLTTEARHRLEALVLWDVVEEDGRTRVYLEGDLIESTDLTPLLGRIGPRVDFDVAGVRHVNSHGAQAWTAFFEHVSRGRACTFSRCSPAFVQQAGFIPAFRGGGTVVSMMAPYCCDGCQREVTRLIETAAVVRDGRALTLPRFRCPECGGRLRFDEVPERYFAFLDP